MRGIAVLVAAVALGACGQKKEATSGDRPSAGEQGLLSATGVVSDVQERALQVRTDDGRVLDFALDDAVAVTLAGGESQRAVLTEGAPVRVSYKPKGSGADLVSIDVEPQAPESKGEASVPSADPPPDTARAANPDAGGSPAAPPQRGGSAR